MDVQTNDGDLRASRGHRMTPGAESISSDARRLGGETRE